MKTVCVFMALIQSLRLLAGCSRESGEFYYRLMSESVPESVVTNKTTITRTLTYGDDHVQLFDGPDKIMQRIRVTRPDKSIDDYSYKYGKLESSYRTSTNLLSGVMTLFFERGSSTNAIDRMEFDAVEGRVVGQMRAYDRCGRLIAIPKPIPASKRMGKEYAPRVGSTTQIGPYQWTIVDRDRISALVRDGKIILRASMILDGRYPWIAGTGWESAETANRPELLEKGICPQKGSSDVSYIFFLDVRDDHIEYFQNDVYLEQRPELLRHYGLDPELYYAKSFWELALSRRADKYRAELNAALQPPKE